MRYVSLLVLIAAISVTEVGAQTTAFTYQGRLQDGTLPANGNYDLEFRLFDALTAGAELGVDTALNVPVTNGLFSVQLDFGTQFPGGTRYLQISVKPAGSGSYTALSPRQSVTSAPYAIQSLNAASADAATNAQQLGGEDPSYYINLSDARLSDARNPLPFSANYVQNRTSLQLGTTDFNISGTGKADRFDASSEFRIQGSRVLGTPGSHNTFGGMLAGNANTTGAFNTLFGSEAGASNLGGAGNTFLGARAGQSNTSGGSNAFVGQYAGGSNTDGANNAFVGSIAGTSNLGGDFNSFLGNGAGYGNTSGNENTFLGASAGGTNTSGSRNTLVGVGADVGSSNLTNATTIGHNAVVTSSNTMVLGTNIVDVQVPGDLAVTGELNAAGASFTGLGAQISNLTITGTLSGSGSGLTALNASNVTTGTLNNARLDVVPITKGGTGSATQSFVDLTTGQTVGGSKIFTSALNTQVQYNLGGQRVLGASAAQNNVFVGIDAGPVNASTGSTFVGAGAGLLNSSGQDNSFIGRDTGNANTTGSRNSFFGVNAGGQNSDGLNNTFLGTAAGNSNTSGSSNTAIGYNTDVGSGNLTNATAVGAGAIVNASNTIVLGTAAETVNVPGVLNVGGGGAINRMRTATANLNFPSVDQTEELDVSVPGAQLGDVVLLGLPSNAHIVLVYSAYVSSAGTVTVRAQHTTPTDGSVDPPSGTFRILVIGF